MAEVSKTFDYKRFYMINVKVCYHIQYQDGTSVLLKSKHKQNHGKLHQ